MGYREMINKVQLYSGFSNKESESALRTLVHVLASRLPDQDRTDLAQQLPIELQEVTEDIESIEESDLDDVIYEIAEEENIDEERAEKQILAAWQALKDFLTPGQIAQIRVQMPHDFMMQLH